MSVLRDRNTVGMVAKFWGCTSATVKRRIAEGVLQCDHIQGYVRITREQVEAYEAKCVNLPKLPFQGEGESHAKQEETPDMTKLRERNTIAEVAEHWGCSTRKVHNLIITGTLRCLKLGSLVRITRQQVEDCEISCTTPSKAEMKAAATEAANNARPAIGGGRDAFQLGRLHAGKLKAAAASDERSRRRQLIAGKSRSEIT